MLPDTCQRNARLDASTRRLPTRGVRVRTPAARTIRTGSRSPGEVNERLSGDRSLAGNADAVLVKRLLGPIRGVWGRTLVLLAAILLMNVGVAGTPEASAQEASAQEASAQEAGGVERIEVGFSGVYKVGHWTPVHVTLRGGAAGLRGRLELLVADADGVLVGYRSASGEDLEIAAGQRRRVTRYVRFGHLRERLRVRVTQGEAVVLDYTAPAERVPEALPSTRELFVTIGPEIGIRDVVGNNLRFSPQGVAAARVDDPSELPDHWCGYEGVDVLVLTTSDEDRLARIGDAQFEALEHAVRMGTRLLWFVGERGPEIFAETSRWSRFAPGSFEQVRRLRDTSVLESYAGAIQALDGVPGFSRITGLAASQFSDVQGRVELAATVTGGEQVPLLIRYPYRFGQVMLVTVDVDQSPFSDWNSRPRLMSVLLRDTLDSRTERSGDSGLGQVSHVGYDDMVGQLRGALDQFSGVTLVAFSWVAVLIGIYILLIGPGDYFFLRRLLRRMHWSWLTFPLILVFFSGLAWYLAQRVRGDSFRLNQVDVLDFDVSGSFARSTTWTHIYSPAQQAFDVRLPPWETLGDAPQSSLLAWQGLPGRGLGGMATSQTLLGFPGRYDIVSPTVSGVPLQGEVIGLPVPVSGTRSLIGRRWFEWPVDEIPLLETRFSESQLSGTIRNPLPVTLSSCALLFGDIVYAFKDDLPPGGEIRLDDQPPPRVLEWRLTRRRVVEQEALSTQWDARQIDDLPRILEIMMFHRAAGGQSYTRLTHRYQAYLDLSEHLKTGRAILVGRSREAAPGLVRDGRSLEEHYDQRWTYCRIVIPVRAASSSSSASSSSAASLSASSLSASSLSVGARR